MPGGETDGGGTTKDTEGGRGAGAKVQGPMTSVRSLMAEGVGEAGEEAGFVFPGELALPNAQDVPAEAAKGAGDEAVAGAVGGDFFAPEGGILFGLRGVERAAVPETAVDEDGEAVSVEEGDKAQRGEGRCCVSEWRMILNPGLPLHTAGCTTPAVPNRYRFN